MSTTRTIRGGVAPPARVGAVAGLEVLTPPLDLPRDPDGQVNVQGAMQAMTGVVESWVREYPEQWLWMHRRWRKPLNRNA